MYRNPAAVAAHRDAGSTMRSCGLREAGVGCLLSSHEQRYDSEHEERHQVDGDREGYRLCASEEGFDEQCVGDVDGDECCDDQEIAVQAWSFGDVFGEDEVDADRR